MASSWLTNLLYEQPPSHGPRRARATASVLFRVIVVIGSPFRIEIFATPSVGHETTTARKWIFCFLLFVFSWLIRFFPRASPARSAAASAAASSAQPSESSPKPTAAATAKSAAAPSAAKRPDTARPSAPRPHAPPAHAAPRS